MEIYALDLDEELLSHIVIPDSWTVIKAEGAGTELIEDPEIAEIFLWQKDHFRQHKQLATATVLADEFDVDLNEPETAIGDLLDRMRERYMRNEGRRQLEEIPKVFKDDPTQIPQLLLRKGRELTAIITKRGEAFGTGDVDRAEHRYEIKASRGRGLSFGFAEIDDHFYGQAGLTYVVAPPKSYKSWIMIQSAMQNVMDGKCIWLYSLELPPEETDMRIRCLLANIPWWKYLHNRLDKHDWKLIRDVSNYIDDCGIYRTVKPARGERGIDAMIENARDAGAEGIYIDQLQYVENAQGKSLGEMNDTGSYWGAMDRARDLSDEGPICIAHQFNRSAMHAEAMPDVSQAKGSSAIEETATLALGLWGNKDMRRSNMIEIGTLISRNHQYAAWELGIELTRGCNFEITGRVDDD